MKILFYKFNELILSYTPLTSWLGCTFEDKAVIFWPFRKFLK